MIIHVGVKEAHGYGVTVERHEFGKSMTLEYHRIQRSDGQFCDDKLFDASMQMLDLWRSALVPAEIRTGQGYFISMFHQPFCFRSVTNSDILRTEETHASSLIIHANHNSRSLRVILLSFLVLVVLIFHLQQQISRPKPVQPSLPLQHHVGYYPYPSSA
jgi:hypothetical protein